MSDTWPIVVSIAGLAIVVAGFARGFVGLSGKLLLAFGVLVCAYAAIEARRGESA